MPNVRNGPVNVFSTAFLKWRGQFQPHSFIAHMGRGGNEKTNRLLSKIFFKKKQLRFLLQHAILVTRSNIGLSLHYV